MDSHVSIKEAAKLTQKGEQTIRRAIKRGDLKAQMISGKYQILVSSLTTLYQLDLNRQPDQTTSQATNQADLSEVIAVLREQLKEKDNQIAHLTQALQAQQIMTMELTKRLPALEEPKEEPKKASLWSKVRSRFG